MKRRLKPIAFWPALTAMLAALTLIAIDQQRFIDFTTALNAVLIHTLSPVFLYSALGLLLLCLVAFVSPLGKVRIGGATAEPIYSPFRWFSVSLTTVIAMGILFWAVAEPVVHFHEPPAFSGARPGSDGALRFALSSVLVHWTLAPYAIYTVAALTFALGFHNHGYGFSIRALLRPLFGDRFQGRFGELVDGLVLFSVVVGMSAVLSGGLLLIGDGLRVLFDIPKSSMIYALAASCIIAVALLSAATGLRGGIQLLARMNAVLFIALMLYLLLVGPGGFILRAGGDALVTYLSDFFPRHLMTREPANSQWSAKWTTAFFASWFAWAPLSCLFLGKIAQGYTVRQFILVNLVLPSAFGILWFSAFGASALYFDIQDHGALYQVYKDEGLAAISYQLFSYLPGSFTLGLFFIFACLISFITAADSNTDAIGGLCTRAVTAEDMTSPFAIKLLWGAIIGAVGWGSATYLGVDGIKMLANLAGLPGLIIVLGSAGSLILMLVEATRQSVQVESES
ncbi:BCCT transporter [Alloalcanivorax dieselolei B5]|uniref:BCCT transporter n=1 Tax=Alcanivorax dieselolei (strain DSM 16502 / CGMCC 1.3690 / MCCC 1A00001 / B-5) TaxID=930169 RepID=K0CAG0_ALCDB|nr:BCCT family transporter [Alloalcanivorax dieselolei]AFT68431.1 BCCT transporter [Alloalcanivorax dieselolei B5]GGJ99741.1 BCCT family transporter [Alloalcanivorax dieselolei]